MSQEIYYKKLTELDEMLDKSEISAVELLKEFIGRTKQVEPQIGAFISFDESQALAQAAESDKRRASGRKLSALDGIPVGLKDVIAVSLNFH